MSEHPLSPLLERIAAALERFSPPAGDTASLPQGDVFVWDDDGRAFTAVQQVNRVPLELLKGIERQRDQLLENTRWHADGFAANNALLWGARGTGKSSLIKAVHHACNEGRTGNDRLALIELHREDIGALPRLLKVLRDQPRRVILFCDDLSFEAADDRYKALKAVLEGGVQGRPANVVFYATSNRRHLMARDIIENERKTAIHGGEAVEEKVSLSDRFGLWLGFHHVDQDTYLDMISSYVSALELPISEDELRKSALEWSTTRGDRSGRVAWQFIQDLAGRHGVSVDAINQS